MVAMEVQAVLAEMVAGRSWRSGTGGAIYNAGTFSIQDSTLTDNQATGGYGGSGGTGGNGGSGGFGGAGGTSEPGWSTVRVQTVGRRRREYRRRQCGAAGNASSGLGGAI